MASGLPAVCADAPGSNSLVRHGETGYLAETDRADIFLEYVTNLVEDPELRRQMGQAALARAQSFDWDAVMSRMLAYYDEILRPASPGDHSPRAVRRQIKRLHGAL